jgi:hypothetical protein
LTKLGSDVDLKTFSQILSFGSEDQRLAYQRLLRPYTLFAALGDSDRFLAVAAREHKLSGSKTSLTSGPHYLRTAGRSAQII